MCCIIIFFQGKTKKETYQQIMEEHLLIPGRVPPEARRMIKGLLEKDPDKRLGHPDLGGSVSVREHKFFENVNFFKIYLKKVSPPLTPSVLGLRDLGNFDNLPEEDSGAKFELYKEDCDDDRRLTNNQSDELFLNFSFSDPDLEWPGF